MWWLVTLIVAVLLLPSTGTAQVPAGRVTARITSQTTTIVVAAVAAKRVQLLSGSVCVDGNGAAAGVALQDTAGTNIIGTGMVYVINPGNCLWFQPPNQIAYTPTASGTGLQVVTTVGNGPVLVSLEVKQQ